MKHSPVAVTTNSSYRDFWDDEKLSNYIKQMKKPDDERIFVLFTENSARALIQWCLDNKVDLNLFQKYYETYIKPEGLKNPELEEFFYGE